MLSHQKQCWILNKNILKYNYYYCLYNYYIVIYIIIIVIYYYNYWNKLLNFKYYFCDYYLTKNIKSKMKKKIYLFEK